VDFCVSNVPGEVGMPDPKRVFEKVYRAPGARRVPGAGLGLFLVHSIVRQLGGSLEYRPEAGMVHFHIWLPE
jgi:signal transduction histidine kinase